MSVKSSHAIENIRKICDHYIPDHSEIEIIDISREKHLAIEYQIIAIPTLIRIHPKPVKIILGDLSDTQKVLSILEIES
ncbi:MAG: circadian clock protein KaiB [Flavobacterium sp.]|nr:MAG: circadian clock protein KaiB [Flavobacterium sp.]